MNKDTVVGILGAVILVAAMVGIFYYEGTQSPQAVAGGGPGTGPFAVAWKTNTTSLPDLTGQSAEGDAGSPQVVRVAQSNITKVEVVLTWTDDVANSGPDQFQLTVRSPSGQTLNASGDSGSVSVLFNPVNAVPDVNRTGGASEAAAEAALAPQYTKTNGTGDWQVTVGMGEAGDVVVPPGTPACPTLPAVCDTGNGWTVTVKVTTYSASVARA
jgi:hypothetical protein